MCGFHKGQCVVATQDNVWFPHRTMCRFQTGQCVVSKQDNVCFPNRTMCVSQTRQCVLPKQDNVASQTGKKQGWLRFRRFFDENDRRAVEKKFASAKQSRRANDETTTDKKVYRRPFCYKSLRRVQNINAHIQALRYTSLLLNYNPPGIKTET